MSNSIVKVEAIQPINKPVIKLTLELTQQDAEALVTVCDFIGGNPDGPRGFFENIKRKIMDNCDVSGYYDGYGHYPYVPNRKDGIYLRDQYPSK